MTPDAIKISHGARVTMHFSLNLESGEIVDSTFEKAPATFTMGDGRLPSGIEQFLLGLTRGEQARFQILPEHAFGQYNQQNVHVMYKEQFDKNLSLEIGTVVYFSDKKTGELPGIIKGFSDDMVTVDFNHPLAGLSLLLDVDILDVRVG